jgi:predicted outer membrane repeat protein
MIMNVANVSIQGGTRFIGNNALDGGALYFMCSTLFMDSQDMCTLNISDTVFSSNLAENAGGAINWNFYEPKMSGITF